MRPGPKPPVCEPSSKNSNSPLVGLRIVWTPMMLVNVFHGCNRPGLHCTWNKSLVGANHTSRNPPFVWVTVEMGIVLVDGGVVVPSKWKFTPMPYVTEFEPLLWTPR